jgi:flagellar biosynthetic protein FliP
MKKKIRASKAKQSINVIFVLVFAVIVLCQSAYAEALSLPGISLEIGSQEGEQGVATVVQLLVLLTVLTLVPSILIMMTSFTRLIIVLSFIRNALSLQQMPPNQVLVGLALFLTVFIMAPVWTALDEEALGPYLAGSISQEEALSLASGPIRSFMLNNTREKDLELFISAAKQERPKTPDDVATYILIPAFIISELKVAFQIGFMIFVPFLVIDIVVASTLMSMGMMMLPPIMISLPFKVLLFVMVDGWNLVIKSLLQGYMQ